MTTVAWRAGVLAADTQLTTDGLRSRGQKLFRLPDGRAAAFAGDVSPARRFLDSLTSDKPFRLGKKESFTVVVMTQDGKLYESENGGPLIRVEDRFYATGSGMEIALGALACGKSAAEAVKIAAKFDTRTGGRVVTLTAKGKRKC